MYEFKFVAVPVLGGHRMNGTLSWREFGGMKDAAPHYAELS